jgi:hypothetical protein
MYQKVLYYALSVDRYTKILQEKGNERKISQRKIEGNRRSIKNENIALYVTKN